MKLTKDKLDSWYTDRFDQTITAEEDRELTLQKRQEDAEQADRSFVVEDEF